MSLLPSPINELTPAVERNGEPSCLANRNGGHDGGTAPWTHNRINGQLVRGAHAPNNHVIVLPVRKPACPTTRQTPTGPEAIARQDAADMICLCGDDDEAMARLMRRHASRLQYFITRMLSDETEAEDVVEETFIRVYRHRERFDVRAKFTTWLYVIALNLARNRLRSRARQPDFVPLEKLTEDELESQQRVSTREPSPDAHLENSETAQGLEASLAALSPQLREPLELFACDDCSQAEIAQRFNCSVKAIETRLYHARKQLRAEFDRFLRPRAHWLFVSSFKHQHEIKNQT
jgi:RNA polymerase sigma-70 factor (ECF subfamily)